VSIHLYGKLDIIEDKEVILDSLNDLVKKYESPDSSYNLHSVEPNFIEGMIKGIVAFRMKIAKLEAKAKLSQNHPVNDKS
jgi:transcriptional regulator